jgi:hypothetical protein
VFALDLHELILRSGAPRTSLAARACTIAGGVLVCLLVAGSASASVQGRHLLRPSAPAKSTARYIPGTPRADPASSHGPLAAIVVTRADSTSHTVCPSRIWRSHCADHAPDRPGAPNRPTRTPRTVFTLPGHWGATHLSI